MRLIIVPKILVLLLITLALCGVEGRSRNKIESSTDKKVSRDHSPAKVFGSAYYELPNRYLFKREIGNLTVENEGMEDQPETLSPTEILMREKLTAYAQKLLLKEAKKQAKAAKKAAKAKAKQEFLGIGPNFWSPPLPATIAPGILAPPNETTPIPPGYWLNKKSVFLSHLFTALAVAANNLSTTTTTTTTTTTPVPPTTEDSEDDDDDDTTSSSEDTAEFGSLIQDYISHRRSTDIDDGNFYELMKRVMTSATSGTAGTKSRRSSGTNSNQYKDLAYYLRQDKLNRKNSQGVRKDGPRK